MVTAGLQPLEFTDCLLDSPEFRENLNKHEKELEKTSQQIKRIIKEVKDLLAAAKSECLSLIEFCSLSQLESYFHPLWILRTGNSNNNLIDFKVIGIILLGAQFII